MSYKSPDVERDLAEVRKADHEIHTEGREVFRFHLNREVRCASCAVRSYDVYDARILIVANNYFSNLLLLCAEFKYLNSL